MRKALLALGCAIGVTALGAVITERSASAWEFPCDFLTGGGFIFTTASRTHDLSKNNFAIGGGCKHGSPTWGHLEYHDHATGLNVHWIAITAYRMDGEDTGTDPKTKQPIGTRLVCGTARTNNAAWGDVDWVVRARDAGEPGVNDEFDIRLAKDGHIVYTTEFDSGQPHKLGDGDGGGGNIQLHKPNPSTTGEFGGDCPALAATIP
jgi:hypothetical protein